MKTIKNLFLLLSITLLLTSCADRKTIDGITYRPYGLLNENSCKNDSIQYETSIAACVSGIVFSQFFLIPTIYTYGFNLYEPVGLKRNYIKGRTGDTRGMVEDNGLSDFGLIIFWCIVIFIWLIVIKNIAKWIFGIKKKI